MPEDDNKTIRLESEDKTELLSVMGADSNESTLRLPISFAPEPLSDHLKNEIILGGRNYKILKLLSRKSAEAEVFLISDGPERCVLKLYYPGIQPKDEIINKLKLLSHPDIIGIIDFGFYAERFYEIEEEAKGGTAKDLAPIKNYAKLKLIIDQINEGLNHCHSAGIIHRDVKPSNIFFRDVKRDDAVLGDFGISTLLDSNELFRRTSLLHTPLYSAPEVKQSFRGETLVSSSIDYYSFGLSVWELFSGALPPDGTDDLEFIRMLYDGCYNFSTDFPEELKVLIKGLTHRDAKKRWGYLKVKNWLNGVYEEPEDFSNTFAESYNFGTDKKGNPLKADSLKSAARIIYFNTDTGRKHFYRGDFINWLKKLGEHERALDLLDLIHYQYKDDELTGTKAACYVLDSDFPFYLPDGTACSTVSDLITAFENNKKYFLNLLKTEPNDFYLYLLAKKREDLVSSFTQFHEKYEDEEAYLYCLYHLYFLANASAPFKVKNSGGITELRTLEDISYEIERNKAAFRNIVKKKDLLVWLYFKDRETAEKTQQVIEKYSDDEQKLLRILKYVINPGRKYLSPGGTECEFIYQIGKAIYDEYEVYKKRLTNADDELFIYFEVKGFEGEISFIRKAINHKEENKYKPALYTSDTAMYKIIRGLGYECSFVIEDKDYQSPEDLLKDVRSGPVKKMLNEASSKLNAWISVFYHEYPLDEKEQFYIYHQEDYTARLNRYFLFLKEADAGNSIVKRFESAKFIPSSYINKAKVSDSNNQTLRILSFVIPFAALLVLLAYCFGNREFPLPSNVFELGKIYFAVFALVTMIAVFASGESNLSTGCIGGPILGVITGIIVYYIFFWILKAPFLLLILGLTAYFLTARAIYNAYMDIPSIHAILRSHLNSGFDEETIFRCAFNKDSIEGSAVDEIIRQAKSERREIMKKGWGISLIFTCIVIAVLGLLIYFDKNINLF